MAGLSDKRLLAERIERSLKQAALWDEVKDRLDQSAFALSGGQKQRLAIARTLLKNPRILIFDDATSSVDTETEAAIQEALERLMAHRTTFVIAHRIQTVMNADLILVMDHGRIIQKGNHDTLINEDGIYREIYDLQGRIEEELEIELKSNA